MPINEFKKSLFIMFFVLRHLRVLVLRKSLTVGKKLKQC